MFGKTVVVFLLAVLSLMAQAADTVSVSLRVETPGTFSSLFLSYNDMMKTTQLKVSGSLNGTDIQSIREMAGSMANGINSYGKLTNLDLSEATIVAGGTYYWIENLPPWMGPRSFYTADNQISARMFEACYVLQDVILPKNVVAVGDYVFNGCSGLTSISLWEGVTSIGTFAFNGCSKLSSFFIPNSVTSLGVSAFKDCSAMTRIWIPESVTFDLVKAMINCTKLVAFQVSENNPVYSSMDGILCSKNREQVICFPAGKTSCNLSDPVTSIANNAFAGCKNLNVLTMSDSIAYIGTNAFMGCTGLTEVHIPENVKVLHSSIFSGCTSLTSVDIPAGVTSIESKAFYQCGNLRVISLPDSLVLLGNEAFLACTRLLSISIPQGVKKIPIAIFNGAGLKTISLPEGLTSIEESAFMGCTELISISLPQQVKLIPTYCFMDCSALTFISMPDSLTNIGAGAFRRCSSLTTITLPSCVKKIDTEVFIGCNGLRSFYCDALIPPIATNSTFQNLPMDSCRLFVPTGSKNLYTLAVGWSTFLNMEEPSGFGHSVKIANGLRIITKASSMQIEGVEIGDVVSVYSILGVLIKKVKVIEKTTSLSLPPNRCYLIRSKDRTVTISL